jgi:hypothetical protein
MGFKRPCTLTFNLGIGLDLDDGPCLGCNTGYVGVWMYPLPKLIYRQVKMNIS